MGRDSGIQWATHTFNGWRGCVEISAGCLNCYARELARRNPGVLGVWGKAGTRVVASESMWRQPEKWNRKAEAAGERHRVFAFSLADVFEDWDGPMLDSEGGELVANEWWPPLGRGSFDRLTMSHVRERLGDLIRRTPNLDWLLLTKRIENVMWMAEDHMLGIPCDGSPMFPPNVWLGVSVEDQKRADERIPHLLAIPAAIRFLSVEPMLGPVDLTGLNVGGRDPWVDCLDGIRERPGLYREKCQAVDWVICGGESGPKARPFDLAWARDLHRQCKAAGVAYFAKQMGSFPVMDEAEWRGLDPTPILRAGRAHSAPAGKVPLAFADSHGGDWDEWPADLRVREFPRSEVSVG